MCIRDRKGSPLCCLIKSTACAVMESDWFDKSYDVIFTNGDKLEFDKKGVWTEVNCKYSAVPVSYTHLDVYKRQVYGRE